MPDVTRTLSEIERGDPAAAEQLLPLVYDELRKLAAAKLAMERPGQTLQATALVHEAYLRLVGSGGRKSEIGNAEGRAPAELHSSRSSAAPCLERPSPEWNSRAHFFAAAAEAMRRILIDQARHKKCAKAGGELQRIELNGGDVESPDRGVDLLALDEALETLEALDPRKAQLVKLRFFGGLTLHQAALALGISDATASADWAYAKAWLRVEVSDGGEGRLQR